MRRGGSLGGRTLHAQARPIAIPPPQRSAASDPVPVVPCVTESFVATDGSPLGPDLTWVEAARSIEVGFASYDTSDTGIIDGHAAALAAPGALTYRSVATVAAATDVTTVDDVDVSFEVAELGATATVNGGSLYARVQADPNVGVPNGNGHNDVVFDDAWYAFFEKTAGGVDWRLGVYRGGVNTIVANSSVSGSIAPADVFHLVVTGATTTITAAVYRNSTLIVSTNYASLIADTGLTAPQIAALPNGRRGGFGLFAFDTSGVSSLADLRATNFSICGA